ncbi:hypothetical protein FACS1894216_01800 [Synergistales bacterium]|nr:hypothetical protein FACS1894216_01800 [Synergistales bacterium]
MNSLTKRNISKIFASDAFSFAFCFFMGAAFFIYIYGINILDFTYTDWLLSAGGDLSQHYMGWAFFRQSEWFFPIGLMDRLVYPFKESIVFTDSIPIFALIFKLFSPLLPANFQYFGLYGIMTYALQGGISGLIFKKLSGKFLYAIVGAAFFVFSAVMTYRMYGHTSLASHYIILLCLYFCVFKNERRSALGDISIWGGILSLAASVHMYFVPMAAIFLCFHQLDNWLDGKKLKRICIELVCEAGCLFITMYLLGYFYTGMSKAWDTGGLGHFSANINSMFNPMGMSRFLKDLPTATSGQYEGFAYIGLGMIIGIFEALVCAVGYCKNYKKIFADERIVRKIILSFEIILLFTALSLSHIVTFGNQTLFVYDGLPQFIYTVWNVFRSSGRMMWPVVYMIMFFVICVIMKKCGKKAGLVILAVLLVIQYQDLSPYIRGKGAGFAAKVEWHTNLLSPAWDRLGRDYKHIFYLSGLVNMNPLLKFASDNDMTVNDTYLARKDAVAIYGNIKEELQKIADGNSNPDTIYVFSESLGALSADNMHIYVIDGLTIGLRDKPDYMKSHE